MHSGVALLFPRNEQQEEFITGMAFARLGPRLDRKIIERLGARLNVSDFFG